MNFMTIIYLSNFERDTLAQLALGYGWGCMPQEAEAGLFALGQFGKKKNVT